MANVKRIEAITDPSQLPEAIIQHIQSFLGGKEAGLTSAISKSWYNSWLTRPTLDFDERHFQNRGGEAQNGDGFVDFVKRSMRRYGELNLKIDHFKLWMNVRDFESSALADELILKAVNMDVNYLNLDIHPPIGMYGLPRKVFEAQSLMSLSVFGCKIDGMNEGKILCSRLKSLVLCNVCIGDDVVRDILDTCPLIENLFLCDCEGLLKVNVSKIRNLEKFTVTRQVVRPVVLRSPLIEFEDKNDVSVPDCLINVSVFNKLSYLLLERVKIDSMLFRDFSAKFPCLEDLTIRYCDGCRKFDISSCSLKYISLAHIKKLKGKFVLPNVHKFVFSGSVIPSISLTTDSKKWVSDIALSCWSHRIGVSWFLELKKFLIELELSEICLSTGFFMEKHIDFVGGTRDFPRPLVENLILTMHSSSSASSALLDGLFWCCRPKILTQYLFPSSGNECLKATKLFIQLLCKKLMDLKMRYDLVKVNAELFEEKLLEWQPMPWKLLLDDSAIPEDREQIRFKLMWGSDLNEAGPSYS